MDSEKINHLKEDGMLREDKKRRSEFFSLTNQVRFFPIIRLTVSRLFFTTYTPLKFPTYGSLALEKATAENILER